MARAEQEQLLAELWTVGMKVPDLVRKVQRRVPLRTVQAWARARRLSDAGATSEIDRSLAPTGSRGKVRKLPVWMQAAGDSGRSRDQLRAVGKLGLTTMRLDALNDLFWTRNRGAIGVRQLYEQLRDHPQQIAAMEASGGKEGWLSWRDVRRWYAIWAPPQTMRRAPAVSQTRAVLPKALVPYAYMQSDVLDMGSWARPEGAAASQQYRYVVVTIDSVTRYVWLCTFKGKLTNAKVARCLEKVVKSVRERYGSWPRKTVLRTDNGKSDFGPDFTTALQGIEPLIRHEHGVANRPNSQALAEGAVGIARGVLRRMFIGAVVRSQEPHLGPPVRSGGVWNRRI